MFCGVSSFSHVDNDDLWSTRSSQRKSRRKEKNPYSNRGLDKFATVVADLEAKREKIMKQVGQEDVVLVRFAYSSSHGWVPIVVKIRDPEHAKKVAGVGRGEDRRQGGQNSEGVERKAAGGILGEKEIAQVTPASDRKMKKSFSWDLKKIGVFFSMLSRPSYYWPVVFVLILLCLVMFGRSFAILCTSIWWYLVPTMKSGDVNTRRISMKKEHGRRLNEKKLGGDVRSHQSKMGAMEALSSSSSTSSPRHHVHGRK